MLQSERVGGEEDSLAMWFMTSSFGDDEQSRIIQTPPEPRPSRCAATSQNRLPFGR